MWNYRLGCPVHSCLERKEHLYLRAGAALLVTALLYAGFRTRSLFPERALFFGVTFAVLYFVLIHLGMYVRIRYLNSPQGAVIGAVLLAFTLIFCNSLLSGAYHKGTEALNGGRYDEAIEAFKLIPRYKDSEILQAGAELKKCQAVYGAAKEALEREDYGEAIRMFESIEDYMDSKTLLKEAKYKQAKKAIAEGDLKTAVNTFTDLGGYKDSRSILKKLTEGALPALGGAVLDMIKKPSEDGSEPGFWDKVLGN